MNIAPIPSTVLRSWSANQKPLAEEVAAKAWMHKIKCPDKTIIGEVVWNDQVGRYVFFLSHIQIKQRLMAFTDAVVDTVSFNTVCTDLHSRLSVYALYGLYDSNNVDAGLGATGAIHEKILILKPA